MSKLKQIFAIMLLSALIWSCQSNEEKKPATEQKQEHDHDHEHGTAGSHAAMDSNSTVETQDIFKNMKFDNTRDFICNMPVTAGVSDTANYKGKVYGFCAKECKDEFLKDPDSYLAKK